jgi:hypothetical protein
MTTALTQAEAALQFVANLLAAGELCERFSEIPEADCDTTSNDLLHIVFLDGSAISINPQTSTVRVL